MKKTKSTLLAIARKIESGEPVTPSEMELISSFNRVAKEPAATTLLKQAAVPLALLFGFFFTVYPVQIEDFVSTLPAWTNLSPSVLAGVDYLWDIIGDPVGKANLLYHLPNIVLYAFGILGIKKLFEAIDRKTWVDRVRSAKRTLEEQTVSGTLHLDLPKGHSALFVGKGDFIGMQFVLNHPQKTVVIAETKPYYTNLWNYYNPETGFDDLKLAIEHTCDAITGEYIFFPVKDDQIFLPGPTAYDLSPHKLDILCQDIRSIEKANRWKTKRIIIVGDKHHTSFVQSEDKKGKLKNSEDRISLETISKKYDRVTLLDPTDIVLRKIIQIARGRKIVFRATKEGIREYKARFYERLEKLSKRKIPTKKGVLTIGYDIFEDQTEQQTLSRKIDDYYPVVLSKNVRDALIRNGYKSDEFIYVPDLVLAELSKEAAEQ